MIETPWKHISEVTGEVRKYIDDRRKGLVKSLRTGFVKLDASNIGGIEWGTTLTIGARPGVGKSVFSQCLLKGFLTHNDQDFDVLDFTWEMPTRMILIRDLSRDLKRSYKYVCSADRNVISDDEMDKVDSLIDDYDTLPIFFVEKPDTTTGFADTVRRFQDKRKRKLLVRVDHTILAKISQHEGDRVSMLLNLLSKANDIKKERKDVTFMFLSQLNREFETRQDEGTEKAFPQQFDCFGGDAAAMYSETMILLNKPSKYQIKYYGKRPHGMEVERHDIFAHIVKSRNAAPDLIIRFREDFETMSIQEM